MEYEVKFRGQREDNGQWVYGDLLTPDNGECSIRLKQWNDNHGHWIYPVIKETVGQLRYKNIHGEYYDGDVYKCSGYGLDVVSPYCEITDRCMHGCLEDIGEIIGNVHDNPNVIEDFEQRSN